MPLEILSLMSFLTELVPFNVCIWPRGKYKIDRSQVGLALAPACLVAFGDSGVTLSHVNHSYHVPLPMGFDRY